MAPSIGERVRYRDQQEKGEMPGLPGINGSEIYSVADRRQVEGAYFLKLRDSKGEELPFEYRDDLFERIVHGRYPSFQVSFGGKSLHAQPVTLVGNRMMAVTYFGSHGHTMWMVSEGKPVNVTGDWDGVPTSYAIDGSDSARRELGPALKREIPAEYYDILGSFLG